MVQVAIPHSRIPISDGKGNVNDDWHKFFYFLWQRTGGHNDMVADNDESENDEVVIDSRVSVLGDQLRDLEIDVEQINDNRSFINELEDKTVLNVFTISQDTNLLPNSIYLCTSTLTATLPDASENEDAQIYIKNTGTGIITLQGETPNELIDDTQTQQLTVQYDAVLVVSDGIQFYVL